MTIPTIKETDDMYENTHVYERCHFCELHTRYWHENTNNPVCRSCAKEHKVADLPDHGQNIRKRKRKERTAKRKLNKFSSKLY